MSETRKAAAQTQKRVTLRLSLSDRRRVARFAEAVLRRSGRLRGLVLRQLRAGIEPTTADVAAALREKPPPARGVTLTDDELEMVAKAADPDAAVKTIFANVSEARRRRAIETAYTQLGEDYAVLCAYVARVYVLGVPRKTGPRSRRTHGEDMQIAAAYFRALDEAARAHDADSRQPRGARPVKARIAAAFGIKVRTLEGIIKGMSAIIS